MKTIWIESNVNYILNILKICDHAINIINRIDRKKSFYNEIEYLIFSNKNKIKYITNKERNPVHTKEVNECFYILLASICYCITSEEIELSLSNNISKKKNEIYIYYYFDKITEINKILHNLDSDLYLFLNEMYIIDELIKIIELFKKKKKY